MKNKSIKLYLSIFAYFLILLGYNNCDGSFTSNEGFLNSQSGTSLSSGESLSDGASPSPVSEVSPVTSTPRDLVPLKRDFPGYGGKALNDSAVNSIYFMTNLNTSGPGSISAAPSGSYVVPLVAGKIVSNTSLVLPQNNIRFLGQLAPGHLSINGSTIFNPGPTVRFNGSNALWEHFSIRASDNSVNGGQTSHKPFTIENNNIGVVLANLSVHYGDDDAGAIWYSTSDITLYRMLVAHSAYNSPTTPGRNPNYGLFVGGGSSKITIFQNVMMTAGRSPHIQNSDPVQAVNNLVYHAGTGSVSNQILAIYEPFRTINVNFHDNLDVRFDSSSSKIWTGATDRTPLSLYVSNNRWRNCAGTYSDMGFHSSIPNKGTIVSTPHTMPILPVITDLITLEAILLSKAGNYLTRDVLDNDVMNYAQNCLSPPVEQTASNYFDDPWPVGPTKPALTFWDQSSLDGLSDAAKEVFGIAPGTNLLSPNDGRWEAVVDFHSGGLLSISIQ